MSDMLSNHFGMQWRSNSCFAAAVVQLLAAVQGFQQTFARDLEAMVSHDLERHALEDLLLALSQCTTDGHPAVHRYTYGAETDCHQQLRISVSKVANTYAAFHPSVGRQQDAHELLSLLFSWIFALLHQHPSIDNISHDQASHLFGTPCIERRTRLSQYFPRLPDTYSFIGSSILQRTTCRICSYESTRLMVEGSCWCIYATHVDGLCGAIREFFAPHPLDGECHQCNQQGARFQQRMIFHVSKFVFFHVSLFDFSR